MNFCLSDLVPPLRWSDATEFPRLRDQPDLPDAWWRSVPVGRVFPVLGPEALGELLTELALTHWPAAAVGDVLPALHVMDPDEADDPQVSIALDRVGSWSGLLALTGRELTDQPFVRARPVLTALFTAVFTRLTSGRPGPTDQPGPAQTPAASTHAASPQAEPALPASPQGAFAQGASGPGEAAREERQAPGQAAEPAPAPLPRLPKRQPASRKSHDPLGLAAARMAEAALEQHAPGGRDAARPSMFTPPPRTDRPTPPPPLPVPGFGAEPTPPLSGPAFEPPPFTPEPPPFTSEPSQFSPEPPPFAPEPQQFGPQPPPFGSEPQQFSPELPPYTAEPASYGYGGEPPYAPAPRPFVPEPEPFDPGPFGPSPAATYGSEPHPPTPQLAPPAAAQVPPVDVPSGAESLPQSPDPVADGVRAEASRVDESRAEAAAPAESSAEDAAPPAEDLSPSGETAVEDAEPVEAVDAAEAVEPADLLAPADPLGPAEPGTPEGPDTPDGPDMSGMPGASEEAADDAEDAGAVDTPSGTSGDELGADPDIPALIDAAFAGLDDQTWTVAQIQIFTDAPAAPEELAKLFAVTSDDIVARENELRERLAAWLDSPEAAPYTQYLEKLPGVLGIAAPKARLVEAAPWHTRELRSLDIPAWQFVMATLPGYTVQDDWLVAGDIADLRERTCGLILNADRPPTVARALELVSTLGIHPEVAKEWLEDVPQLRIQSTKKADQSGNQEAPQAEGPAEQEGQAAVPLKDVSMTRKCFRHPDGLWWLRIDIGPEQLSGAECPLPSGFAAYLGMSPGDRHTVVSAAGEVTITWQSRPAIESLASLLAELGAESGSALFVTVAEEDQVLRAGLIPPPAPDADKSTQALRLAGYTVAGGAESLEETIRVLATRIGMTGPVGLPDLMNRLRERGDRDLLSLMV
ncbi:hypothetical protein Ssi03_38910 [Sphaerisporangium siamense]|uniref:Uncharacterized protein n=1 Tax=Sphaerisporangium siamense TaxID=795645 RepID=A0A7W7D8V0_9ACTN|nr:hypothetical protein [Sphaerisporangium siamense]MBB4700953.1 hypothetical protein [Sphaerisporangium siamense]GII85901.1 hypothetical protein Ssi03_38910 [Sphaerisporangium siamense]